MTEFQDSSEFFWYKRQIELNFKTVLNHLGEPERYPCRLINREYSEGYNDKDNMTYTFIYRQEVKCEHCGHVKLVWPEVET